MRKVTCILIFFLAAFPISRAQAANGRISHIQITSICPAQTVIHSGQTVQLSAICSMDYNLSVGQTGTGSSPHTYRLVWPGGSRGPAYGYTDDYQFSDLSGANTYTVYIDEGAGGESWTITIAAALPTATLTVLSPNGGENWISGGMATVTWTSAGLSLSSYVKIHLNRNYPAGMWETISSYTTNDGTHSFALRGATSATARVRLVSTSNAAIGDTSNANFTITGPVPLTLAVTAPNGGEDWTLGNTYNVTWGSTGLPSENVKIEIKRGYPAGLWETLAASTANTGSFLWTPSGIVTPAARIRISGTVHTIVKDTSNANFALTSGSATPAITVTSPNGGENWTLGSTPAITWTATALPENVRIELNRSYPGGIWETLIASAPNTGTWAWTPSGIASQTARVRISGTIHTAVADTSNANFTLTSGGTIPAINVTLPNGGEYWPVGSSQTIYWTSSNLPETVKIEVNRSYPTDDWEIIAAATDNDGAHPWTIAGSVTGTARVRISGTVSTTVSDVSDAMFTINGGSSGGGITVTGPNGGENWLIGITHIITWSAPTLTGNVKIEINRGYPTGSWTTLISSTANDGSHTWLTTPGSTPDARVRISSVTSPTTHDVSDGDFAITNSLIQGGSGAVNGIATFAGPLPTAADLMPNYPNPFNPSTTFEFGVPEATSVSLKVFDVMGREVTTLLESAVVAGQHRVTWNCPDCPAGVYLVVLSGSGFSVVQKATFLK